MKASGDDIVMTLRSKLIMPIWHHYAFHNIQAYEIIQISGLTMETLKTFIGSRIQALRKARDLSQADLAGLLSCEPALFSRYERGQNAPSVEQLLNIANAFNVPAADLLPSTHGLEIQKKLTLQRLLSEKAFEVESIDELERLIAIVDSLTAKK